MESKGHEAMTDNLNNALRGEWLVCIHSDGGREADAVHHIRLNSKAVADEVAAWLAHDTGCNTAVFHDPPPGRQAEELA
jgi:hypothetical protein